VRKHKESFDSGSNKYVQTLHQKFSGSIDFVEGFGNANPYRWSIAIAYRPLNGDYPKGRLNAPEFAPLMAEIELSNPSGNKIVPPDEPIPVKGAIVPVDSPKLGT
jgi:hypothetical protein